MIYPEIEAKIWAKRYNISQTEVICEKCGLSQKLTIPFAYKNKRGLMAKEHACGPDNQAFRYIALDSDYNSKLKEMISLI